MFEYANNKEEVVAQGIRVFPEEEPIEQALTVNLIQVTKPTKRPIIMLYYWNKYINNRMASYIDSHEECFFRVNDEIDEEYPPHLLGYPYGIK